VLAVLVALTLLEALELLAETQLLEPMFRLVVAGQEHLEQWLELLSLAVLVAVISLAITAVPPLPLADILTTVSAHKPTVFILVVVAVRHQRRLVAMLHLVALAVVQQDRVDYSGTLPEEHSLVVAVVVVVLD